MTMPMMTLWPIFTVRCASENSSRLTAIAPARAESKDAASAAQR